MRPFLGWVLLWSLGLGVAWSEGKDQELFSLRTPFHYEDGTTAGTVVHRYIVYTLTDAKTGQVTYSGYQSVHEYHYDLWGDAVVRIRSALPPTLIEGEPLAKALVDPTVKEALTKAGIADKALVAKIQVLETYDTELTMGARFLLFFKADGAALGGVVLIFNMGSTRPLLFEGAAASR